MSRPYFTRRAGRAVLRSSVRELLCSEAMHHLGIPTTRALSLVTTGDAVVRTVTVLDEDSGTAARARIESLKSMCCSVVMASCRV